MGIEFIFNIFKETIGIILFGVIILVPILLSERRDATKLDKKRLVFNKKLKDGIINGRINDISHIRKLYASIVNTNYFYLNKWSKEVLFDLDGEDNKFFDKLNQFIDKLEFEEPFSELPSEEKEILSTLLNDRTNNTGLFENKLHSLSNIIKVKYAKKEKSDKWVKRLTIASFILTIFSVIKF
jgi:hypothetical protein